MYWQVQTMVSERQLAVCSLLPYAARPILRRVSWHCLCHPHPESQTQNRRRNETALQKGDHLSNERKTPNCRPKTAPKTNPRGNETPCAPVCFCVCLFRAFLCAYVFVSVAPSRTNTPCLDRFSASPEVLGRLRPIAHRRSPIHAYRFNARYC